jgi:N-acyl-D-aspartate/D-glutamate deacylase
VSYLVQRLRTKAQLARDWEAFELGHDVVPSRLGLLQTAVELDEAAARIEFLEATEANEILRLRVALYNIYEWYDRDGSVGEADRVFEENRPALSPANPTEDVGGAR